MYRSRHKEDLDKRTLNFLSSIDIDDKILYYDILCTKVHVIMLYKIHILDKDEVARLIRELDSVLRYPERLSRKGYEDIHEALEIIQSRRRRKRSTPLRRAPRRIRRARRHWPRPRAARERSLRRAPNCRR